MGFYRRKRWAYYSRNDSYGKSANAENAEANGRFPKSRAAKELGLSAEAFKAGRHAINYFPSEYHHVGRYATSVTYYDTEYLREIPEFWKAAALAYKSKSKRIEIFSKGLELEQNQLVPPSRQLCFSQNLPCFP